MGNLYKEGENRKQQMFFPPSIDEYVSVDNPVRAIEDYVEMLNMIELGFTKAALNSSDGQPAYHPKLLLKIYIYGYLNKVRSSRRLEVEIKRNIEMMWLCAGLQPSYKTIANFRKDNSKALKKVFREFVLLCREIDLVTGELVAIDGAFLRANASKNQLISKKNVVSDLAKIDENIDEYLNALNFSDTADKTEQPLKPTANYLSKMKTRKAKLDKDLALLEMMGVTQYNRTDPDAKKMVKPSHNLMAYNSQIAVDSKYKLIIATDVSSEGQDYHQLYPMAKEAKAILDQDHLNVVADAGYYGGKQVNNCKKENITPYLSIPDKQKGREKKGFFPQDAFTYDPSNDLFICPNQKELHKSTAVQIEHDTRYYFYGAAIKSCSACPVRSQCIPEKSRFKKISISEHYQTVKEHARMMQTTQAKNVINKRAAICEHPFGTTKQTLGWSHFLVRGIEKVSGENALIMFIYNFRRILNLIGPNLFRKLMNALKNNENIDAIKAEIALHIALSIEIWAVLVQILQLNGFRDDFWDFEAKSV
ncbi:MAG: IS1182 family transposase [Sulfuricurvum sp.]|uniref:IS1182 family transposase n=1 Tax=Sulfuricurvum sp. TaxID=2025608 RepID=UPI0025F8A174|nr:IS1182 family transposase [Sulfuricurvum sp.]MCI4406927.1 IS1182 family transposase [Sulfuricurvum sp.]